jgi:DNA-binding beta-propeller fold protein YncE
VCAADDVVAVSEYLADRISVFSRADGSLRRMFGSRGSGDGQLNAPHGVCFTHSSRRVAVADFGNNRVSVFSVNGAFVCHVGVDVLKCPFGVASSAFDELVVADSFNKCVRLFDAGGELLRTFGRGFFTGVAVHGGDVFAQDGASEECVVFS